jgi:RND family efflux transporter MFP subunit
MKVTTTFRLLLPGALALTTLCLSVGCSKEKEQEPEVTVQVALAEKGKIEQVISTEAILYPIDQAALTPKVTAPVKAFYVNRGSKVHRGETVAVLENRDLAAAVADNRGAYEQAQAAYGIATSSSLPEEWQKAEYDLKAAKADYEAQQKIYDSRKTLFEQGALPRKEYDQSAVALIQSKAAYEIAQRHIAALEATGKKDQVKAAKGQLTSAEGKLENASAQLSYSTIVSPINGVVTDRPLYPGETAAVGTPLMTIMDTSTVIAKAHIPQSDAVALKPGDAATIIFGDSKADGKVTVISPALDPNSTTVEVWVSAANSDNALRPGSTVKVDMTARTMDDAVTIPLSAVLKTPEGASTVMVAGSDGKAHQVNIETGIREDDRVQITKGLNGNERVIAAGGYGLPDGTKIKIAETPAAEAKPGADDTVGEKPADGKATASKAKE